MNFKNLLLRALLISFLVTEFSFANERRFTYVYQSTVMGKGFKEVEISSTTRLGKNEGYFAALDNRIEFEVGLGGKLQTAFYLNFSNVTTDNGTGVNQTSFIFKGISSEWKYQVSDPSKNALGFALYSELGLNTDEVELETKLIFDKKINRTTLALNLTYEPEWYFSTGETEVETNIAGSFGLSYAFTPSLSAGFEVRNHNIYTKEGGWENSALFGGPVISYAQPSWWMTFTVLPQIAGLKGKTEGSNLSLHDYEKFESRLIFSFHI
jgi:hypothetical protein